MIIKFFEVTAKCGHVGRNQYYEGIFYEKALDAKTAAAVVRNRPRVKHDHKDAILWVREISYEEYVDGQAEQQSNPYFMCKSPWEQRLVWDDIVPYLRPEKDKQRQEREPKRKRPYKRKKLSLIREIDYAI